MLNDAYVDDDAMIAPSPIPEKTSDAEAGSEVYEDVQINAEAGSEIYEDVQYRGRI